MLGGSEGVINGPVFCERSRPIHTVEMQPTSLLERWKPQAMEWLATAVMG